MDIWRVLLDVVVLLGAGALLGGLFELRGQSAIIGYLLAGAMLGPNALHLVRGAEEVLAVSELGVALLLFAIGLEFSWSRLRSMGRLALGSGGVQVLVTTALGAGLASLAGFGASTALTLGAIAALSSTASVLRTLASRGEVESVHGERALGVLLVQDVAVVPAVLIVTVLNEGGTAQEVWATILRTAGIGLALVVALYVIFNHVVPRLLSTSPMRANRELPILVATVSGLGSGVVAHSAGVSPALGAFVAGMLLAESPFAIQVRADVSSLKTLLLTLFFTAIGMLSDPVWIASNAVLVAAVVAGVVLFKAAIVFGALRLFGARARTGVATGLCLGQIGEFSFVLADIARGGLLDEHTFLLVVSSTVLTMIFTPYLVAAAPWLAARLTARDRSSVVLPAQEAGDGHLALVVGFGPAGRAACERIAELGCRVVVVDQNPASARDAHSLGYRVVTGDALNGDVLDHAGLREASFVVVTVPSGETALRIVQYVRITAHDACVLVRARFHRSLAALKDTGAHVVVDEENEVGRQIALAYEALVTRQSENNPGR